MNSTLATVGQELFANRRTWRERVVKSGQAITTGGGWMRGFWLD
ncbi:hypothetical protein [Archangium violaceum]